MGNGTTMISLASLLKSTAQSSAASPAKAKAADVPGAAQAFPDALAAAAPAQAGEAPVEMAPAIELAGQAAPGTTLPISLRGGKTLPVVAGDAGKTGTPAPDIADVAEETGTDLTDDDAIEQDQPAKAGDETTLVAGTEAQRPLTVAVLLPVPLPLPETEASVAQATGAAGPKHVPTHQSPMPANAEPQQMPVEKASTPSVVVGVSAGVKIPSNDQPVRGTEGIPKARDERRISKDAGPAVADLSQGAVSAKMEPQLAIPAGISRNAPVDTLADRGHLGGKAVSPAATLHDLTSVVDRLVAAREALAPATAAITVQHGELGDLSLRFDQHRDGHLAVQLSASDPDAHRAIVAAVSDAGFRAAADGQGSSQQPAQTQASARGHTAERDSGSAGNGSAARHDQPQQHRPATQPLERPGGDRRRAGVFA